MSRRLRPPGQPYPRPIPSSSSSSMPKKWPVSWSSVARISSRSSSSLPGHALEVAPEDQDLRQPRLPAQVRGVRVGGAVEQAERARVHARVHVGFGGLVGDHDRDVTQELARPLGQLLQRLLRDRAHFSVGQPTAVRPAPAPGAASSCQVRFQAARVSASSPRSDAAQPSACHASAESEPGARGGQRPQAPARQLRVAHRQMQIRNLERGPGSPSATSGGGSSASVSRAARRRPPPPPALPSAPAPTDIPPPPPRDRPRAPACRRASASVSGASASSSANAQLGRRPVRIGHDRLLQERRSPPGTSSSSRQQAARRNSPSGDCSPSRSARRRAVSSLPASNASHAARMTESSACCA